MTTRRKPSASLTRIMKSIDEDELRRARDRMLVASKIADTLKARNITQKKFAEMMCKSESEISEWLSGNRNFTIDTLSDIRKCLGVDILNISDMHTARVPKGAARIKIAKARTPVIYDMRDIRISSYFDGWQTGPLQGLSLA